MESDETLEDLHEHITRFSAMGDIIILKDFNAQTKDHKTPLHDRESDSIYTTELNPNTPSLQQFFEDSQGPLTR